MKKILITLLLASVISFSKGVIENNNIKTNSEEKFKIEKKSLEGQKIENINFNKINLKIIGMRSLKNENEIEVIYEKLEAIGEDNKKYTENDLNKPRIIIDKVVSTLKMRYLIETDDIIVVALGLLEPTEDSQSGVVTTPYDLEFNLSKFGIKRIYMENGKIYMLSK